jgi:uncharacterized membrane protein YidH (DUF202 family)
MAVPGVQNERTALAWQRTALSLMTGAAILSRVTFTRLGPVALVALVVSFPLALWAFLESRSRYQHDAGVRLRRGPRGGRAPAALALATVTLALVELLSLLG